ncbi:thiamine pyrophosphate-dependent enzyme, partial [Enterobacter hormaechei]
MWFFFIRVIYIRVSGGVGCGVVFRYNGIFFNFTPGGGGMGRRGPRATPTAIANPQRKVVGLVGDGGVSLNLG